MHDTFGRVTRSYLILFCPIFWQNPIFPTFWEMSYFITILPLILLFYSLFITIISCENIPSNFLASLHLASRYFLPISCRNPFLPFFCGGCNALFSCIFDLSYYLIPWLGLMEFFRAYGSV